MGSPEEGVICYSLSVSYRKAFKDYYKKEPPDDRGFQACVGISPGRTDLHRSGWGEAGMMMEAGDAVGVH